MLLIAVCTTTKNTRSNGGSPTKGIKPNGLVKTRGGIKNIKENGCYKNSMVLRLTSTMNYSPNKKVAAKYATGTNQNSNKSLRLTIPIKQTR